MKEISEFQGEFRFLSNFWPAKIKTQFSESSKVFEASSVEVAYQAAKAMNEKDFLAILTARSPAEAKKMGRRIVLRPAWAIKKFKLETMLGFLRQKFSDPRLKAALLATEEAELIEGNTWGDTFWGVCNGKGENNLGKLLMKVREELK